MTDNLVSLEQKLRQAEEKKAAAARGAKKAASRDDPGSRAGIQAGLELVTSVVVGVAVGYGLDVYFGTKPVLFLIFFLLGIITGFFNVYRVTQNLGSSAGFAELHRKEKDATTAPETKQD